MENWVVLYARTGSEEKLVRTLKDELDTAKYLPFVPFKETSRRTKGVINKERKPLFPGYLFVKTSVDKKLIAEDIWQSLKTVKSVYSLLHYGEDKNDVALRDEERSHWECLLGEDFCINGSMGFIEGDKVRVSSGALVGMETQIKKINRHKREAVVEIEMMGAVREVTLMLEVVSKI